MLFYIHSYAMQQATVAASPSFYLCLPTFLPLSICNIHTFGFEAIREAQLDSITTIHPSNKILKRNKGLAQK